MTVVHTTTDLENLTLTVVADLAASPSRVWQVWVDPRRLERWWGPATWPATFVEHDVAVGGTSRHHMSGPDGAKVHGWWRFTSIDEPRSLMTVRSRFASTGQLQQVLDMGVVEGLTAAVGRIDEVLAAAY